MRTVSDALPSRRELEHLVRAADRCKQAGFKRLDDLQRVALACAKYSREYISEQATARSSERHVG
jgi:hypothetical protein